MPHLSKMVMSYDLEAGMLLELQRRIKSEREREENEEQDVGEEGRMM